jgi:hypothetical protein
LEIKQEGDEIMEFEHVEQLFKKYQRATGGIEPIGLTVPVGFPCGIESWEEVIEIYKKCIDKGITWEKLLNYKRPPEDVEI